jgi:hypothetical protein
MPHGIQPVLIFKPETMADKSRPAKQRTSGPHTRPLSTSDDAVDKAQEARIKRPIKTKKINLETFRAVDDAKKWKRLNSLINAGQGPLRLWKAEVDGARVLYLRPRTWCQYFYETLFLFPAERDARCAKVRAAIQMYIRPCLDAQVRTTTTAVTKTGKASRTSTILNAERAALLDRLDCRVYTARIDPGSFYGNKPTHVLEKKKGNDTFSLDVRKAYDGMTTVAKGLSIAKIAPFKVMADVRILTKTTHILADGLPTPGENCSPPDQWTCLENEQLKNSDALREYYMGMLNAYGQNKYTMVLEVGDDNADHWRSAYHAAHQWLGRQPSRNKPSIMLVPPYRKNDFVPSGQSKTYHHGWPALMANMLRMEDVEIPNQVSSPLTSFSSSNASGSASRHKSAYVSWGVLEKKDNDNDNDNDNDGYPIAR